MSIEAKVRRWRRIATGSMVTLVTASVLGFAGLAYYGDPLLRSPDALRGRDGHILTHDEAKELNTLFDEITYGTIALDMLCYGGYLYAQRKRREYESQLSAPDSASVP